MSDNKINVSEWRSKRTEGELFTLPSGLVAKLKRVQLLDLAQRGQIPTPLVGVANELISEEKAITIESFTKYSPVIDLIVSAAFVDPVVTKEPTDESISVDELTASDRMAVYNWVNELIAVVRPFRYES